MWALVTVSPYKQNPLKEKKPSSILYLCFLCLMLSINNVCLLGNASAQFSAPSSLSSQITLCQQLPSEELIKPFHKALSLTNARTHARTYTSRHCSSVESLYQVLSYTWISEMVSLTVTVLGSGCTSTCLLTFSILISRIMKSSDVLKV